MERFLSRFMPPDFARHGAMLDRLNANVHWLMFAVFLLWGSYFVYVLIRFRAGRNPQAQYADVRARASTWGEIAIALAELFLLAGFSIPAWFAWSRPPVEANPMVIRVIAEQFAWNIHYPGPDGLFGRTRAELVSPSNPIGLDPDDPAGKDDVVTVNDLHLIVNRPVIIRLTSKDVIHSFFLPVMRVKQDAIPGMETPVHFTPLATNRGPFPWEIACAQLCGLGHYRMRGQLVVQTAEEFAGWMVRSSAAAGRSDRGRS